MKIEVWFDVACPYCYIGLIHLERALNHFAGNKPEIVLRSFELEPDVAINSGETQHLSLMRKYRQSPLRARQTLDAASNAGNASGLLIDFDKVIITNTFNAHRLIHFAVTQGRGLEMTERLFRAYFAEGKHIGKTAVLAEIAAELGIDVKAIMDSDLYSAEVRKDEHESYFLGIRSIPFFLFDGKNSVCGTQSAATFLGVLTKLQVEK